VETRKRLGRADLHIHSLASDGLDSAAAILDWVEARTDLDIIAIADHDEMAGTLAARELAARRHYRFEVVTACEISTRSGHLLALGIERPIRLLQSLEKTIELVHQQGGLAILAHPLSPLTFGVTVGAIDRLLRHARTDPAVMPDGIEVFCPSLAGKWSHERVNYLNNTRWQLPRFGASDAHSKEMIGTAVTCYPGRSYQDLVTAMRAGQTSAGGQFWSVGDHLAIAGPNLWRSLIVTPGMRVRKLVRWVAAGMP